MEILLWSLVLSLIFLIIVGYWVRWGYKKNRKRK